MCDITAQFGIVKNVALMNAADLILPIQTNDTILLQNLLLGYPWS